MSEIQMCVALAAGFVPYRIERENRGRTWHQLEIRALFWSLTVVTQRRRPRDWTLRVQLIERSCDAVWAAVMRIVQSPPAES